MIRKVINKPVVREAIEWNGDNFDEIFDFSNGNCYIKNGDLYIRTIEGDMKARVGNWILKGVSGEIYPVKADIFYKTYDFL